MHEILLTIAIAVPSGGAAMAVAYAIHGVLTRKSADDDKKGNDHD